MKDVIFTVPDEFVGKIVEGKLVSVEYCPSSKNVQFTIDFDVGEELLRLTNDIYLPIDKDDWKSKQAFDLWSAVLNVPHTVNTFKHLDGILDLEHNSYTIKAILKRGSVISYFTLISASRSENDPTVESLQHIIMYLRGVIDGYREMTGVKTRFNIENAIKASQLSKEELDAQINEAISKEYMGVTFDDQKKPAKRQTAISPKNLAVINRMKSIAEQFD